ncbi:Glycosyl transferase, group 2 family protein [Minicystis rosea]|nr:Glycosyl transferase, group 2 family protein [Minicystis rosea]
MKPRVSVLLPYRDAAETVAEALGSVLDERGIDFEVIAIDDGSRDAGPAIVDRLAAREPRVVPLATGGLGIAGALAHGTSIARGELVARMDADDISLPGRLAAQAALLDADPDLGAAGTLVDAFPADAVGEGMRRYVAWLNSLITPADHDRDLFVESPLCHPSVIMRRDALDRAGGYLDVPWAEDYDLWLRIHAAGFRLAKVPEVLLRWRQHARRATLVDPRYALHRFDALKARHLAPRLRTKARPIAVWGAGKTGKHLARALEAEGVQPALFVDIDPRKIGSVARGVPIVAPSELPHGTYTIVVAVGARGARDIVRGRLDKAGFVEGEDYVCAS